MAAWLERISIHRADRACRRAYSSSCPSSTRSPAHEPSVWGCRRCVRLSQRHGGGPGPYWQGSVLSAMRGGFARRNPGSRRGGRNPPSGLERRRGRNRGRYSRSWAWQYLSQADGGPDGYRPARFYRSGASGISIEPSRCSFGPSAFGFMSNSKMSVGSHSVAQALGISTTPEIWPCTGAVPRIA